MLRVPSQPGTTTRLLFSSVPLEERQLLGLRRFPIHSMAALRVSQFFTATAYSRAHASCLSFSRWDPGGLHLEIVFTLMGILGCAAISLWSVVKSSALRKTIQPWRILQRVLTTMLSISFTTPPALLYQVQWQGWRLWNQELAILSLMDFAKFSKVNSE